MKNKFINGNLLALTDARELYLINGRDYHLVAEFGYLGPINAMVVDGDYVILATTAGLFKYNLVSRIGNMLSFTENINWTGITNTLTGFLAVGKCWSGIVTYEKGHESYINSKLSYVTAVVHDKYYNCYKIRDDLYVFVSDGGVYTMVPSLTSPVYDIIRIDTDITVRDSEAIASFSCENVPSAVISMISTDGVKINYIADNHLGRCVNDRNIEDGSKFVQNSFATYTSDAVYVNDVPAYEYNDEILHIHNTNDGRYVFFKGYYYYYNYSTFTCSELYDAMFDHTVMCTATISPVLDVCDGYRENVLVDVCMLPLSEEYYSCTSKIYIKYPNINEVLKTSRDGKYTLGDGLKEYYTVSDKISHTIAPEADMVTDIMGAHKFQYIRNPIAFQMIVNDYKTVKNRSAMIDTLYRNKLIDFVSKFGTHFPVYNDIMQTVYYPTGLCLTVGGNIIPILDNIGRIPVDYLWYDETRNLIVSKHTPHLFNISNYITHNKNMIANGTTENMIYSYIVFEN